MCVDVLDSEDDDDEQDGAGELDRCEVVEVGNGSALSD